MTKKETEIMENGIKRIMMLGRMSRNIMTRRRSQIEATNYRQFCENITKSKKSED